MPFLDHLMRSHVVTIRKFFPLLGILLVTAAVYLSSVQCAFVHLDDSLLVYENSDVTHPSVQGVAHAFSSFDPELYIPFTLLSFQVESLLFGMQPWHFHLINVLLHLMNVVLVFLLITELMRRWKMQDGPSTNHYSAIIIPCIAAALFALHPINSEAVYWVTGRKDLLFALFFLASLTSFLQYQSERRWRWYALSVTLFLCSLLSKVSGITLPIVLLLLDLSLGQWRSWKWQAQTKLPFFLLSTAFGLVGVLGKTRTLMLSPIAYVLLGAKSVLFALWKIVWPMRLSAFYLTSLPAHWFAPIIVLSVLVTAALVACAVSGWRRRRLAAFAAAFFLVTYAPSILTIAKGKDLYLFSDRYVYVPSIAVFLLVGWLVDRLLLRASKHRSRTFILAVIGILLVLLAVRTAVRSFDWRTPELFSRSILAVTPDEYHALYSMGYIESHRGNVDLALDYYRRAIEAHPTYIDAYNNTVVLLADQGKLAQAQTLLLRAIELNPKTASLRYNLGLVYQKQERWDDAIAAYKDVLRLDPNYRDAHRNLATVYGKKKMYAEGLAEFRILQDIDPDFAKRVQESVGWALP